MSDHTYSDNPDKQASMELTESARETTWKSESFAAELFRGTLRWGLLHPFPLQDETDRKEGDSLMHRVAQVLTRLIDPSKVDRTGEIPVAALHALAELGCYGIKIPREYGGLGLSQANYNRTIALIASHCASTAVMLSAHQSIGLPQPLMLFGTEEQKQRWLPQVAHGALSAFALTEPWVGSDPARLNTTATPSDDGKFYTINGLKMWCTNGPAADLLVVMAQTPPIMRHGKEKKQITAFIVERGTPGFRVEHICKFMGLNGIQNGLLRFDNVRVPADQIIGVPGEGLKIALTTLNTGRLTLPAASAAVAKSCLRDSRLWAAERRQWGSPIGEHQAVSDMLARMASDTYACEVVANLAAAWADRHDRDIRLEAAIAKYATTELSWRIVDDALQVRGGRGYETAESLAARGESPIPLERMLRDTRINRIIEGTSEIMRLFIAREALDTHVRRLLPITDRHASFAKRRSAAFSALGFYLGWYPAQWLPSFTSPASEHLNANNCKHLRRIPGLARRLSRELFHAMLRHREGLEKQQLLLQCFVDIGTDLFIMSAVLSHADSLPHDRRDGAGAQELSDLYCRLASRRVDDAFRRIRHNDFARRHEVGQEALHGNFDWLESGIMPGVAIHAPEPPQATDATPMTLPQATPEPMPAPSSAPMPTSHNGSVTPPPGVSSPRR